MIDEMPKDIVAFMIRVQDEIQQEAFARTKCLGPDDILNQLISRYASNKAKDYDFTEQAELLQIITTIAVLRAERDEARREVCAARRELCRNEAIIRLQRHRVHRDSEGVVGLAKEIAVERGWDCFKENT